MQILAACNRTSRERTRTARAKSVQFVPGMSCDEVKESPGETAISTGAFGKTTHGTATCEDTALLTLRHPIIALHWGIAA